MMTAKMMDRTAAIAAVLIMPIVYAPWCNAQSSSLIVREAERRESGSIVGDSRNDTPTDRLNHSNEALHELSVFTIRLPELRQWEKHDLVHVIIRETSSIKREADASSEREYKTSGSIDVLPYDPIDDFVRNQMKLTEVGVQAAREFEGKGDYERDDDFTARLTARVVEVLPNEHLVIEARTYIETDDEISSMVLSGICDPDDVSPAGTILSSDVFDLRLVKDHQGELRKSTKKGFLAQIVDSIFGF